LNTAPRYSLVDLFQETGRAHHAAFAGTDGADPEWPIWYAEHLHSPLGKALQMPFTKSRLIYCLMDADFERTARAPQSDWPEFYADHFFERFAGSSTPVKDSLVLYQSSWCPFCSIVRSAIEGLGLDVELRDIFEDSNYRDQLIAARGRATVPVLRITSPDGEDRWMPESQDIVRYLEMITK
jgi:glutaredoxin